MKFELFDDVLERADDRIVVLKQVSRAEEYLADHFPGFPVLPGVMILESMAQAARRLLEDRVEERLVLGEVRAMKFGSFLRPGEVLEVEVTVGKAASDGSFPCRGIGRRRAAGADAATEPETAVSGRFTMRPLLLAAT